VLAGERRHLANAGRIGGVYRHLVKAPICGHDFFPPRFQALSRHFTEHGIAFVAPFWCRPHVAGANELACFTQCKKCCLPARRSISCYENAIFQPNLLILLLTSLVFG
jgi:hypothetical protein